MEIIIENERRVLVANEGHTLQSVTDGSLVGDKIILGKKDSETHYHEIPVPFKVEEDTKK